MSKYGGTIMILDEEGNPVFERELSADEMIAELIAATKKEPTGEHQETVKVVDEVLKGPIFNEKSPGTKEKLEKGDRVQYSAKGLKQLGQRKGMRYGELVGFSRDGKSIRVLLDGTKIPGNYHPSFFEAEGQTIPATEETTAPKKRKGKKTVKPCCGSKQNRHKKGCTEAPAEDLKDGNDEGKKLATEDEAWENYQPPFSEDQWRDIKQFTLDGKSVAEIVSEMDLPIHQTDEVRRASTSPKYEIYVNVSRRAHFG